MTQANEVLAPYKAKVLISRNLAQQVQYINNKAPKNKEWSGLLIYQVTKGGINDLTNLEIKAEAVFPMDFGDATFTSFEGDDNWMKCFAQFPQIDPIAPQPGWFVGKIHTHPNFNVFHSATDKNDLYVTAPKLPMFLSLIVNYATETDCELAIAMEVEETLVSKIKWKLKGWLANQEKEENTENKKLITYVVKCDVDYEQEEWMIDQIKYLQDKQKPVITTQTYLGSGYGSGYSNTNYNGKEVTHTPVVRKFVTEKVAGCLPDLITLGEGERLPIYDAVHKTDLYVDVNSTQTYQKALKLYFAEYWYPAHFFTMQTDEYEVMAAVKNLLKLQNGWIVGIIRNAINELEKEYPELWKV